MTWLKQSTAVTIKLGPFVDDTDGKTAETALTISQADVRLSKNGGDFAQKNDANAAIHDENGYYDVALDATDTATLGRLRVAVSESGALPVWADFEVVPAQVWDSFFASDRLQVDTREFGDANLALTTQMKADVNAEADTALADYDGPTVTEMNARTLPSADYFDPATDTVANVTTVGSVTNGVTVATNNDKTGYALTAAYDAAKTAAQAGDEMDLVDAPNATAIAAFQAGLALAATALSNATWTDERAALLDYLDAAISSRLAGASYTAPDNAALTTLLDRLTAARAGYLDKLDITGTLAHSDAANTYKADVSGLALEATAQSIKAKTDALPADPADDSDIDAQLAAIAAYIDTEVAAILAAVDTEIAAIKAKTDSLTFTTAGKVDARVDNVAGTAVAGPNDLKADVSALATSAELTTAVSGLAAETTAQSIKAKTDQLTFTTPNKVDASAEVTVDAGAIAEAVAEVVGETVAAEVWEHTPRTLTQSAIVPGPTTTAGEITRRRGDSWEITLADLSLEGCTEVWFTIKRGHDYIDDDAFLMVTLTGGLVRLNGAAAEAGDAALAITGTHDAATITVRAEATAQLPTGTFVYDLQWMDAAGDIHTVSLGTFTVSSDVTRATS